MTEQNDHTSSQFVLNGFWVPWSAPVMASSYQQGAAPRRLIENECLKRKEPVLMGQKN